MSFSSNIKKQLSSILNDCPYCDGAELAGIIEFSAHIHDDKLTCMTENLDVANRICRNMVSGFGFEVAIRSVGKMYTVVVHDADAIQIMKDSIALFADVDSFANTFTKECCMASFIRGCFLGGGSVSNPEKSYHIEFDTKYKSSATHLCHAASELGHTVKETYRKGGYVVYAKECESVADILGQIGAGIGVMQLYNIQIEKEMRNTINRQVNCETANVDKVVRASVVQTTAIEKIRNKVGLESLPDTLYEAALARLAYPQDSLKELAVRLGIGKSGMNHRLKRIIEVAEDL